MKEIWQIVSEIEENLIIKSYYQSKVYDQDESIKILKTLFNINELRDDASTLNNLVIAL